MLCCCCRGDSSTDGKDENREGKFGMEETVMRELTRDTFMQHPQRPSMMYKPLVEITDYFIIGNILGTGDTCVVFAATFIPTNKQVAMKYMTDYAKHRFHILRELQVLKISDKCPYLVNYHSHFRVKDKCYIVTDQLSKINFSQFLYPNLSLPPKLVKIYTKQLSTAVIYLHSHKIIHRDINLKNIVLDSQGNLRLIDYNLSIILTDPAGMRFSDLGSFQYSAPEIYKDKMCSYPVDWWSVGVCLYRFVTGGYPYPVTNRRVFSYYVIKSHMVVYPAEFFKIPELHGLTERLLNKKPKHRLGAKRDDEIKTHPYYINTNWDERDCIQETILSATVEDLKLYRESYRNIMPILDEIMKNGCTSNDSRRWSVASSIIEGDKHHSKFNGRHRSVCIQ